MTPSKVKVFFGVLFVIVLNACSSKVYVQSENINSRVNHIVIHATSENFSESLRLLTKVSDNPVSSHYLIPSPDDPSYKRRSLKTFQLVDEMDRAWHAGVSFWNGKSGLNDQSIGIEIVNEFTCDDGNNFLQDNVYRAPNCEFPEYPQAQIDMLIELMHELLQRYPDVEPINIVAHSDIAIFRKSDPGPVFPWFQLYQAGIGAWYDDETRDNYLRQFEQQMPSLVNIQQALRTLGYDVQPSQALDLTTQFALRAFQLHFRPNNHSGEIDAETAAILYALIEKYRPESPFMASL